MINEDNLKLAKFINFPEQDPGRGIPFRVVGSVKDGVNKQRRDNNVDLYENWDFYQGNHAPYFSIRRGEPREQFQWRKDNSVISNYCEFIVNLGAKFLYGRPERVRRNFTEGYVENKTEKRLRDIEKSIGFDTFIMEAKRKAGIFGEQPVRLVAVDSRYQQQIDGPVNAWTYPHPIFLDPRFTWILRNKLGRIAAVVIEDSFTDFAKDKEVKTVELVVEDSRWLWHDGVLVKQEKNKYSLREEFVVFDNNDTRKDDIQPIKILQLKLDEALTDVSHFFEKHGWPQLVTQIDLSQVMKAPGYIWHIESDMDDMKIRDQIDFLTWDGKESSALQYIENLESEIFKLSATAAISTGDLKGIGNLRSGAALVTAYGPSIQKAQARQVVWGHNEWRFWWAVASLDSTLRNVSMESRFPKLDVKVAFPTDFVPGEELIRAEIRTMEMNSHTTTLKDILRERFPALTETEINAKRDEIIEDSEKLTDSKRQFETLKKGQPVQSGEKKSAQQK